MQRLPFRCASVSPVVKVFGAGLRLPASAPAPQAPCADPT